MIRDVPKPQAPSLAPHASEAFPRALAAAVLTGMFAFVVLMIEVDRRFLWRYFPVTRAWEYALQPSPMAADDWRALVADHARRTHPDFDERSETERRALEQTAARELWPTRWQSLQMDWYGRTWYALLAAATALALSWLIARLAEWAALRRSGELLLAALVVVMIGALSALSDPLVGALDRPWALPAHPRDEGLLPEPSWSVPLKSPLLLAAMAAGVGIALFIRHLPPVRAWGAALATLGALAGATFLWEMRDAPAGPYSGGLWTLGRVVSAAGFLGAALGFLIAPQRHAHGFAVAGALMLLTLSAVALALYFLFCTPLSGGALFEPE